MTTIDDFFPSKYLKAGDLKGDTNVQIKSAHAEEFEGDNGIERKLALSFMKTDKQMILNKTNATTIGGIHGGDLEGWAGKWITVYPAETEFRGKMVPCLRVKLQAPTGKGEPAPPPAEVPQQHMPVGDDDIPFSPRGSFPF